MKPKKRRKGLVQSSLIKVLLKDIISDDHPLVKLAGMVEWEVFEDKLGRHSAKTTAGLVFP